MVNVRVEGADYWRRDGRSPPENVLRKILDHVYGLRRPVYLGEVSLSTGWNLMRTQEMVDVLVDRGMLRPLTGDEKESIGISSEANVYALVKGYMPSLDGV